ncbi:GlsB/YeaQ/YmgE family stress response membrane protein [Actinomycetaceae bacterium TAE3-ERU4]|nr:GlsB/YeaQ/YmgE family stress response membrane protein [Actinomycetaceae bacterium TAE3-ERU4]
MPALGIIGWIVIGGLAGWIASKVMGTDATMGIGVNILVGIIGGFIGGGVLGFFGFNVSGGGLVFSFFTCLLGAVILIWIVKLVSGRK